MCGIIGIVHKDAPNYEASARAMLSCIAHRGPDGDGVYAFPGAILGHRRLSIIDLSTGAQPMFSPDKKVAITFNGEIYGYKEIKKELDYPFQTTSDTEVILALYKKYGQDFTKHLPGMFAFAIWDDTDQTLIASRDRFGEKPFYYAFGKNKELIFASEIKAILASGLITPEIDPDSIAHYLHKLYVHPQKTIYKNIFTLPPAHTLKYKNNVLTIERYWNIPEPDQKITLEQALPKFKELLRDAVKKQLVADVPVGAFLSGGLDSTTVVSLATEFTKKIKTFSFGYEGTKNELSFARLAAEQYNTEHYELHDKDHNIAELILKMADIYDEPFADSSNVSTYLISKLTREHSTVVLSGDGGDELLGGYGWYKPLLTMNDDKAFDSKAKMLLLQIAGRVAMKLNLKNKVSIITEARRLYYKNNFDSVLKAHRASNVYFKESELKKILKKGTLRLVPPSFELKNNVEDALRDDIEDYMPGDILVKTDRASMANSLELRAPFLDVPFAEFVMSLPYTLKLTADEDKILLRRAFEKAWPEAIQKRNKLGFGAPVSIWLKKKEVQDLVTEYLLNKNKKIYSYISYDAVEKYIIKNDYKTWVLLSLSIWLEKH